MDLEALRESLAVAAPPAGMSLAAQALRWDAKGNWQKAHECAQEQDDETGAWVHAYLHRKEGDASNAGYWYRRAGKPAATVPLADEWDAIARAVIGA
jgi:hypothetical protein